MPPPDGPPPVASPGLAPPMELANPPEQPVSQQAEPRCVHFGACGGCQYQHLPYGHQLALKAERLRTLLHDAGLPTPLPELHTLPSPAPYGYRNRIRLRVRPVGGAPRLGYSLRGTTDFLPVTMCPIAAPVLEQAIHALTHHPSLHLQQWLGVSTEAELFTDPAGTRLQLTLLCPTRNTPPPHTFPSAAEALHSTLPALTGAGAHRFDPHSGRVLQTLADWGDPGLLYPVPYGNEPETYWITRGGFFQVNRLLLPALVEQVCGNRAGALAWDLFAGVGLFSRPLARQFTAVTAVEANPTAAADLTRALARLGPQHRAVQSTTFDFLRTAALQRDRPDLLVLDPPRAGAGVEVCELLNRVAAPELVYLSCDPVTLARDLATLTGRYRIGALHLIDLFPQTLHIEALAILHRL